MLVALGFEVWARTLEANSPRVKLTVLNQLYANAALGLFVVRALHSDQRRSSRLLIEAGTNQIHASSADGSFCEGDRIQLEVRRDPTHTRLFTRKHR
jgi:hypothetical protein